MANTIKRFGYRILKMDKSDSLPSNPIVIISLNRWSVRNNDVPTISPHLMTEGEIDFYIDNLKEDLDSVGRQAKIALKKAETSTLQIIAERNSN